MSNIDQAYEKALKFLKNRLHSEAEIRRKLTLRGFNDAEIDNVAIRLTEEGLISDAEFATAFLDSLLRFKTWGYYGLLAKLYQRGIDKAAAEELLRNTLSVEEEAAIAVKVVEKERNSDKLKLAQKLSRKGFRTEVIRQVLSDSSTPNA